MRAGHPALGCALWLLATVAAAESPLLSELVHDPFARPERGELMGKPKTGGRPILRSTLVAGARSAAGLDGVIVPVGAMHQGHRLLEVRAFSVLLEHDGRKIEVEITSPEKEEK